MDSEIAAGVRRRERERGFVGVCVRVCVPKSRGEERNGCEPCTGLDRSRPGGACLEASRGVRSGAGPAGELHAWLDTASSGERGSVSDA